MFTLLKTEIKIQKVNKDNFYFAQKYVNINTVNVIATSCKS